MTQPPISTPVPGYVDPRRWAGRTVTVASQGGEYQRAQTEAMFDPFATATGVRVRQEAVDLDELRRQVEAEDVTWDVVDLPVDQALKLAREGLLLPIDYQVVDRSLLVDEIVLQHAVGAAFYSTVIGYRADLPKAPSGWADLWDVAAFPGPRALRRDPVGTLEFALLADGVPPRDLYPLDVERAFASLDRIKPHVAQWYDNALQPVKLLANGAVVMTSTFNVPAETREGSGLVALQWQGGMLSAEAWVVPRGAPNTEIGMDLINFATRATPTANLARLVPFGPVNRDADKLLWPDRLALLPSSAGHRAVQFVQNWNWWLDNETALGERFADWLLIEPSPPSAIETPPA